MNTKKYEIPTLKSILAATENGNHLFEVVSLFAGGGGSSTGYRMAGGKVLAINEFVEEAQKTYELNYPNTYIFRQDIRTLSPEDILLKIGKRVGELDILDGSPPCSAFSISGSREKGWGKTKKYSDTAQANVEDLFFEYVRMVRGIRPKVFIAENVSGLAKGAARGYLNKILSELRESGYVVSCRELDARYLGVPQSRARLIFIGIRNDLWKDSYKGKTHPVPMKQVVTTEEAFLGLEFTDRDRVETCLPKGKMFDRLIGLRPGEKHEKRFSLVKISPNRPSACVLATGDILANCIKHWDNRALTISELKRLMSIPDDYILTGTYKQKAERLGRMVAPFMMRAVASNLYNLVLKNENENTK